MLRERPRIKLQKQNSQGVYAVYSVIDYRFKKIMKMRHGIQMSFRTDLRWSFKNSFMLQLKTVVRVLLILENVSFFLN